VIHKVINDRFYGGDKKGKHDKLMSDYQEARRVKNETFDGLKKAKEESDRLKEAYNEHVNE
jgi:hypothetical protein